jgi:hypothetical protein
VKNYQCNTTGEKDEKEDEVDRKKWSIMKNVFFVRLFDTGIFGVKGIVHMVTPAIVMITPANGRSGMNGQRRISRRLNALLARMITVPVISSTKREKNPMMRETSRSINMWNLRSREELAPAVSAEI